MELSPGVVKGASGKDGLPPGTGMSPGMVKGSLGKGVPGASRFGRGKGAAKGGGGRGIRPSLPGKGGAGLPNPEDDRIFQKIHKRGAAMPPVPFKNLVPPSCVACGNFSAKLHCGRCKVALFCDEICQRRVWPTHKNNCNPPDEILQKIKDDPNGLKEDAQDLMAQEVKTMAQELQNFFARGGKKQVKAREESRSSIASTGGSSDLSSRAASSDGRSLSPAWAVRRQAREEGKVEEIVTDAPMPGPQVAAEDPDAKRPEWLRQAVREITEKTGKLMPDPEYEEQDAFSKLVQEVKAAKPVDENELHQWLPMKDKRAEKQGQPCGGVTILRNGVQMPRVVLGTGGFFGLEGKQGREAICAALKLGYRAIDTSEMNRNLLDVAWAHLSSGIPRADLFIIAKIAPWNYGYARTRQAFFRQLDELRVDYVDLLLVQWPHCWAPAQTEWGMTEWRKSARWRNAQKKGSWRAFEELYSQGKAKAIGIANHTIDQFEALQQVCNVQPHVWQCESHPHWSNRHIRNWCREKEVAFQGYAPFGGENDPDTGGGRCALSCPVVTCVAEKVDKTPAQVCMFWNLTRNASVVVKSKNYRHLRENLHVPDEVRIPSSHLGTIDQLAAHWKEYGPCYWGHNDVDNLHPWHNEALIQKELTDSVRSPIVDNRPGPLVSPEARAKAKAKRATSQEPQPPPGAFAPGDGEEPRAQRASSVPAAPPSLELLPDDQFEWMWGDASLISHGVAEINPLRWSYTKNATDTILEMGKETGKDLERPVEMVVKRAGTVFKQVTFKNTREATAALSPQMHRERQQDPAEEKKDESKSNCTQN